MIVFCFIEWRFMYPVYWFGGGLVNKSCEKTVYLEYKAKTRFYRRLLYVFLNKISLVLFVWHVAQ